MDKLKMQSLDIVTQNIEKLSEIFPTCVTESPLGRVIDFDQLKQELSVNLLEGNKERYRLEWPGKREAIVTANLPINKTLRPVLSDSINFDTTENIYIEGDNLEVLKLLQESYLGKIKMIYIDPPYNTGYDFVYKDSFSKNKDDELFESGQKDELNQRLVSNPEASGRYHSNWLSMMYPRLKLARNLLSEDGVMFISIDDNEQVRLKQLCDEIFSENVEQMIWRKSGTGRDGKMKNTTTFRNDHEYVIVCFKNNKALNKSYEKPNWVKEYGNRDNDPRGSYEAGSISNTEDASNPDHKWFYEVTSPSGGKFKRQFQVSKEEFLELDKDNRIYWGKNGDAVPRIKIFTDEKRFVTTSSLIEGALCTTTVGSKELEDLFKIEDIGLSVRPKPVDLIKKLLQIGSNSDSIILDFFSGSATTAHAVMQLNSENKTEDSTLTSQRKFIMVQLPEKCDEKSIAFSHGFKTIPEIGKDRIHRAAEKIKNESSVDVDFGYRAYRLDDSNMQDVYYRPQDYDQSKMDMFTDNVKPDRTADDLLAQVILDWGLPLNLKIEEINISGRQVYKVADDLLYACFDQKIDEEFAKEISKNKPLRIVFRDSGFKDNSAKTNVKQLLKQLSPETEMKVI
jgi:adenine-specific DNA-methyltransferase